MPPEPTTATPLSPPPVPLPSSKASGFKVLLFGGIGTGKTYSIGSLADTGLKVRCLFTEQGLDTLGRYFVDQGKKIPPQYAWHYVPMSQVGFPAMLKMTERLQTHDLETLTKLPANLIGKDSTGEFRSILGSLANFQDDRTGRSFGSVETWGNDTVLVLDSFTGLCDAMSLLQCGLRPIKSMADWQIIQNHVERLMTLISQLNCHVVVTGHWEREQDEVTGQQIITISGPGKKLAPRLGRPFSDVLIARRDAENYYWSANTPNADLKTRHLARSDRLPPSFAPLYKNWLKFAEAGDAASA